MTTTILHGVKLVVIGAIVLFIYLKLKEQPSLDSELSISILSQLAQHYTLLIIIIVLMPVNWALEAKKWMILASPIKSISFGQALTGVLTGLSLGFITPHGIGDYIGRVLMVIDTQRGKLIGGILVGRFAQLLPTLAFGAYGLYYLIGAKFTLLYLIVMLSMILVIVQMANMKYRVKHRWIRWIAYHIDIIKRYSSKDLALVVGLALLRYIVFTVQLIIAMRVFLDISLLLKMAGTTWIWFAKSVIPTFNFLSDLGVREFSAVYFFDRYDVPVLPVLSASFLIWIINLLIPTIVGLPWVWKLKLDP